MFYKEETRSRACIIRVEPTSDETPPWAGLRFVAPIGSDELSDLLRSAYPEGRNLHQRKHLAAIEFLKYELEKMQAPSTEGSASMEPASSVGMTPQSGINSSHDAIPVDSRSQTRTCHTSPSVSGSIASPLLAERTRPSVDQKYPAEQASMVGTTQTFVFSATDGKPMQQRTKKKMSMEERRDYKETRKRGACLNCRRAKAKCTHENRSMSPAPEAGDGKRAPKRSGSQLLDKDQFGSTKLLKREEGNSFRQRSPEQPRPDHNERTAVLHPPTQQLPIGGSMMNSEWTRGQGQGYVQNLPPQQPLQSPLSGNHNPGISPFSQDAFSPGFFQDPHLPQESYQNPSPVDGVPDPYSNPYQYGFMDFAGLNDPDAHTGQG